MINDNLILEHKETFMLMLITEVAEYSESDHDGTCSVMLNDETMKHENIHSVALHPQNAVLLCELLD